ncbi:MAG: cytochrome P450, partial [Byssovorax sp.]
MSLPPGPSSPAIVQTLQFLASPGKLGVKLWKRYGDVYTIKNSALGTLVVLVDPELIKQVFTGDPDVLHAGEANRSLELLVGDRSLLLLDGPEHLRHRRMLLPPFHGARMQAYAETMRAITEEALDAWTEGESFSLHPTMQKLTLEIILRTVFGLDLGPRNDQLTAGLTTLFGRLTTSLGMLMMIPAFQRNLGSLTSWAAFQRDKLRVDELLYAEIAERRAELADPRGRRRDDVLTMLLEAKDEQGEGLSDKDLRDELLTLLAAGHETTATSLCWAFERILNHPDVEDRLRAELAGVAHNRAITAEDLPRLEYLDATIKEVLRMRPVIPTVARMLKAPMKIRAWEIPAGVLVAPAINVIHQREDLYPEPERFKPERFLGKKQDPYTYFPFGGGTRRCIGMAFALYEMKIVLATVLRRTKLKLERRGPLAIQLRTFVMAPKGGTR